MTTAVRRALAATGVVLAGLAVLPGTATSAAEPMTTITMNVSGCDGCTIFPSQQLKSQDEPWNGTKGRVKAGQVVLVVPTSRTNGMVFAIQATPMGAAINAEPLIVMSYKAVAPGTSLTKAQAMTYRRASPCWVGTTASAFVMDVTVKPISVAAFPSGRTKAPLAWANPMQPATAPYWPTVKGMLATQNTVPCG